MFYSPQLGYWVVTRYEDIKAVFRDNVTFSPSVALEKITPTGEEANEVLASYDFALSRTLVNEDEPEHMARRRALMGPFSAEHMAHHEPMIRRLAREAVDRFIDLGRTDLVDEMLWETPLTVALEFLGVPDEDKPTLREYSIAHTVNTWGKPAPAEQVEVAHAVGKFWEYSGQVLEKMRQAPDEAGWMQFGIRKQQQMPDVVTDSYLHSMMMAGIVAAHETTAHASANAIKLLLENRPVWEQLCREPELIPNAVEECLRHNGSQAAWRRISTRETEIGGVKIPSDSRLLLISASGNHDERHFGDPGMVDVRRDDAADHLTFGYGAHQCLGKNLARMEMQIILEELTSRIPHMRLIDQEFSYVPNTSFRGPEHLWIEWDPEKNPERVSSTVLSPRLKVNVGEPTDTHRSRRMRVESITQATTGIRHLRLSSADGTPLPSFAPGSHIDIECGSPDTVRQYSLFGSVSNDHSTKENAATRVLLTPEDAHERPEAYEIAILRAPDSRGGSDWIHDHVAEGDILTVRGPRNHFRLPERTQRLVLVAGGIGITPIRAMAALAKANGTPYEIHYLGRARATMAFLGELTAEHGDQLLVHCSEDGTRADLGAMMMSLHDEGVAGKVHVYVCGPQSMIDDLQSAGETWPEESVVAEHFSSTLEALNPEMEHEFIIHLEDSNLDVIVPADKTVLQALRDAQIGVPANCKEGLCGTCEVPVIDGEIDHRDVVLTQQERRAGDRMMACCSRACGKRLVLGL
ncbi:cytochrome P450/oxidoreductase [Arthrobacter sp. PAMC 25486]|uniref:cytochrome P450/oxidoreductase n=1 Tax=Arthrobacter sp. PAMC 25486 TaxID=1494608 RepID=UPI0020A6D470|nr:cytochrome P450/oxidoreductase [Arthrobacter sp. PAMC 25486]